MSESERDIASLKKPFRWWSLRFGQRTDQMLLVLSILIGALTGATVVALILLTERLGMRLYPVGSPLWRRLLTPVAGSLAMGYVLLRYFPDARGSGVGQTKVALFARDGVITLRTVLGKFFCTAVTLGSGIPLGPEGPSVQIGAGIASVLGRRLRLRPESVRALIPVGAAAAIAAAFNTPLAAVVYSLEEIVGDLNAPVLGSVVLASATSWLVLRLLLGNNPLFQVPQYQLVHPVEFAIYAVLGVIGGLFSVVFMKLLIALRARFRDFPAKTQWFQPVFGGLVVGLLGWRLPQVLGVGYPYVGDALNGRMLLRLMALLVLFKFVAIIASYASGNAGGLFAPSLFMGAMVGGTVGSIAHHLWPAYTAEPGAYALVGMGALFAGIMRAPMTSVLMIFETTHDYAVIVPLMIANLVSYLICSGMQPQTIYSALSLQDGIHLPTAETQSHSNQRRVAQIMRGATEVLPAAITVSEALERIAQSSLTAWPIVDKRGLVGMLARERLELVRNHGEEKMQLNELLTDSQFPHVHPDHPLHLVLERMGATKLDVLPVVSRANLHELLGIVVLSDVLNSFGIERSELHGSGL
jgi:chloride channel protein, CIC family